MLVSATNNAYGNYGSYGFYGNNEDNDNAKTNQQNGNEDNAQSVWSQYYAQGDQLYNQLTNASAPSGKNIVDIFNAGYKTEAKEFNTEHTADCDIYGDAAQAFGQARDGSSTVDAIKEAFENWKEATEKAVNALKALVTQEDSFIDEKEIERKESAKNSTEEDEEVDNEEQNTENTSENQTEAKAA